jgi:hypothetical protein
MLLVSSATVIDVLTTQEPAGKQVNEQWLQPRDLSK